MPVSSLTTVTDAPATVAPLGSLTVPEMLAVTPAKALPPAMRSANAASARVSCLNRGHRAGVFLCNDRCSGRAVSSRRLAEILSFIVPPIREPSLGPERRMQRRVLPSGGAPSINLAYSSCGTLRFLYKLLIVYDSKAL